MYVTYKLLDNKNNVINSANRTSCFSLIRMYQWVTMELLIYESNRNKGYTKFWMDLVKKIEPKITFSEDYKYAYIPNFNNGKTLIILTIIRYLWEDTNAYDIVVKLTEKIINKYPDIDVLEAITMAASSTTNCSGWGHSLVNAVADHLVNIQQYQDYKGDSVHKLFNKNTAYPVLKDLGEIRMKMINNLDIEPVLKHFNYEETRQSRAVN